MASFDQTTLVSGGAGFIATHTVAAADWRIILLRYFNPVGAHESGKLGEDPKGIPNNRMPYIQEAVGRLPELNVYGHDYPTKDGMWGLHPCGVFGTKSVK